MSTTFSIGPSSSKDFAIHSHSYVPPDPVSHGWVRISDEAIDRVWANDVMPIVTAVWIY
ncbi:MAG TPA: hypothetical protein VED63_10215 [Acidimicrobiales bacterium]|nr:hypothetical protein [Acidimicrobiales bacterium]